MRAIDRDLIRGGHYGQRPCVPHLKAEHMAAPTKAAYVKKALANSEPSTHGTSLHSPRRTNLVANGAKRTFQARCRRVTLLRDFVARQLRDGSRLGLDAHLAVSLRHIARTVTLNGIQDAVLNACLNANGLEAAQRHPTTFASMVLWLSELCHAPSFHWQRYGNA